MLHSKQTQRLVCSCAHVLMCIKLVEQMIKYINEVEQTHQHTYEIKVARLLLISSHNNILINRFQSNRNKPNKVSY